MFNFSGDQAAPKCFITQGLLPRSIHPHQVPTKKQPLATFSGYKWLRDVEVILPKELYNIIWPRVEPNIQNVTYHTVIMSLREILEGAFFNVYIKTGNISMLSEGRPGIDSIFSIYNGILRLELSKEMYEQVGLVGTPILDGTRKHIKTRYAIEINLRLPSMVHGRKGFERILRACESVLVESVKWLFYDPDAATRKDPTPISKHHPQTFTTAPKVQDHHDILIAPIHLFTSKPPRASGPRDIPHPPLSDAEKEDSIELLEWLDLVTLASPRIDVSNTIDSYISRYSVPTDSDDNGSQNKGDVVTIQWRGYLPAEWARDLFVSLWIASEKHHDSWLAMSTAAFKIQAVEVKDGFTILRLPSRKDAEGEKGVEGPNQVEYMLWEMVNGLDNRR